MSIVKPENHDRMQKIFITGGSGDLGSLLTTYFKSLSIPFANYDMSRSSHPEHDIVGDITNSKHLCDSMRGYDAIIHIAELHGIHELNGASETDFNLINVQGTLNVINAAKRNDIHKIVFFSSESVNKPETLYDRTKIECERMFDNLCNHHLCKIVSLRCRSFIPHTNKKRCKTFLEWVEYFSRGGVHATDVAQAFIYALDYCDTRMDVGSAVSEHLKITIDGKYEVLKSVTRREWSDYLESIFTQMERNIPYRMNFLYEPPKIKVDANDYPNAIGYEPRYSIRDAISEYFESISLVVTPKLLKPITI